MGEIFIKLLNMSILAGWLILAVIGVRLIFRRIPRWIYCVLWGVVAIRLIVPFSIESVFSLQPSSEPIRSNTVIEGKVVPYVPSMDSKLPFVENTVNPVLYDTFAYEETDSVAPLQVAAEIAAYIWLMGVAGLLIFAIASTVRLHLMVKEAVYYKENAYLCDSVKTPFILGVIRPRIYLPSTLSEEEIKLILAHEKAHLKRLDHLWKPIGYMLLCAYWFHPLCVVAYILLCKDIELACDEKVIKDMSIAEKKEYSRVLLSCATQRRFVITCPLAFGEVGVKERVKTVLNYKKAAVGITVFAILVCIVVAICFLTDPSKKDPEQTADTQETTTAFEEETVEKNADQEVIMYVNDYTGYLDELENYYFRDNYENLDLDGDGKKDRVYWIYTGGNFCNIELRFGDGSVLVIEEQDIGVCPSFYALPNEAGKVLIAYHGAYPGSVGEGVYYDLAFYEKNGKEYVLSKVPFTTNSYKEKSFPQYMDVTVSLISGEKNTVGYSCKQLPDFFQKIQMDEYDIADMSRLFENGGGKIEYPDSMFYALRTSPTDPYVVECRAHIIYHCQDELMVGLKYVEDEWQIVYSGMVERRTWEHQKESDSDGVDVVAASAAKKWAQAFCSGDGETIVSMASGEVMEQFEKMGVFVRHGDDVDFGFTSSPMLAWPDGITPYVIAAQDDINHTVDILYYPWTSDPHVTVWREQITLEPVQDGYRVSKETLTYMENIVTVEEFLLAYPFGIRDTLMNYAEVNLLGEYLNRNALLSSGYGYKNLFDPVLSVYELLNLQKDGNIRAEVETSGDVDSRNVRLQFPDGIINVYIGRPYGGAGIWVPTGQPTTYCQNSWATRDIFLPATFVM